MTKNQYIKYTEIINDFHDYLDTGKRQDHDYSMDFTKKPEVIAKEIINDNIDLVKEDVISCTNCTLCKSRINAVPGEGVNNPLVLVIGEVPGKDEDKSGRPFVGNSGEFLDKWLDAIELDRNTNSYMTNIIKCSSPGNREPHHDEVESCLVYLKRQINILKPKAILCVGNISTGILLNTKEPVSALRGRKLDFMGIPLVPTFHPNEVLANMDLKRPVWEDLKKIKSLINNDPLL